MIEGTFSEYWNQAQFCYFKAEAAEDPPPSTYGHKWR